MRRFGRLVAAAGGVVVVMAGVSAGSAAAAQAGASVHGCPHRAVCLYPSKAAHRHDQPTVVDTMPIPGVFVGGTRDTVAVNTTASYYSSQGYIEEKIIHYHYFCEYVPDDADVQAPGTTENPGDGANVNGIATATTKEGVESIQLLPLSDCGL